MGIAEFQAYTLSPIDQWKDAYQRGGISRDKLIPVERQVRYETTAFGFNDWIRISQENFDRARALLNDGGTKLRMGVRLPFSLMTSDKPGLMFHYGHHGSDVYLIDNVLIAARPLSADDNPTSPHSPHFRDGDLVDHVNLAIFAKERHQLQVIAAKLELPSINALVKA